MDTTTVASISTFIQSGPGEVTVVINAVITVAFFVYKLLKKVLKK